MRTPMLTCDGNLRFKHFRLWRNNKLTGIRHNMAKLLNVLFSNSFGRSSKVTESTFIRLDPTEEWLSIVEFSSAPISGSLPHRCTQRRFSPKYIENTFYSIQSTFRYIEMHSKRRYKICICSIILGERESFRNYQCFSIIFPQILDEIKRG